MSDSPNPNNPVSRRGLARRVAVQALYQWLVNTTPPEILLKQFREQDDGIGRAHPAYLEELIQGTVEHAVDLTLALVPHLDRPIAQLDPVEHAVLLLGAYELSFQPSVPWRVIVNEAVTLAKLFGSDDGYKYINGVLDHLARQVRPAEVEAEAR
jgi:N utilization substance protein B